MTCIKVRTVLQSDMQKAAAAGRRWELWLVLRASQIWILQSALSSLQKRALCYLSRRSKSKSTGEFAVLTVRCEKSGAAHVF